MPPTRPCRSTAAPAHPEFPWPATSARRITETTGHEESRSVIAGLLTAGNRQFNLHTAGTDLVARVRAGEELACARLMSLAERGDPRFPALHDGFFRELGRARRLGITGPPGAGKSTLVEALALHWRAQGRTLGIVAVDPTSPFSGGALLGDRVRMGRLALDKGVFIRSMATRGVFGGLARATDDVVDVLDPWPPRCWSRPWAWARARWTSRSADITVVVLHPGGGDVQP